MYYIIYLNIITKFVILSALLNQCRVFELYLNDSICLDLLWRHLTDKKESSSRLVPELLSATKVKNYD